VGRRKETVGRRIRENLDLIVCGRIYGFICKMLRATLAVIFILSLYVHYSATLYLFFQTNSPAVLFILFKYIFLFFFYSFIPFKYYIFYYFFILSFSILMIYLNCG
jgi:hypothetical protein